MTFSANAAEWLKVAEPFLAFALVGLFAALLFVWTVFPVSNYDEVYFLDHDDWYQTEQFLLKLGEEQFAGTVDYGSELYLYIPFYRVVTLGDGSPLSAFRFIKSAHILAAAGALLFLRAVVRRMGVPWHVSFVFLAVLVSSPALLTYAQSMKPDANVVLFTLSAGLWALVKFDEEERAGWLLLAVVLAALGTAVKWWGGFLLVPTVYLLMVKQTGKEQVGPLGSIKFLGIMNLITWLVLTAAAVTQGRYIAEQFPHTQTKTQIVSIIIVVVVAVALAATTAAAWWLDKKVRNSDMTRRRLWMPHAARGAFWALMVGGLWAACFAVFDSGFLISDQLRPTLTYFTAYSEPGAGGVGSIVPQIGKNIWNWAAHGVSFLMFGPLVAPFVLALLLMSKGSMHAGRTVAERAAVMVVALVVSLAGLLFLFVAKINDASLAMLLPFLIVVTVVPFVLSITGLKPALRMPIMVAFAMLITGQIAWQSVRAADYFGRTHDAVIVADTLGTDVGYTLDAAYGNRQPLVLVVERHVPIRTSNSRVVNLSKGDYKSVLLRIEASCAENLEGGSGFKDSALVMDHQDREAFALDSTNLLNQGCIEELAVHTGQSYVRGNVKNYAISIFRVKS